MSNNVVDSSKKIILHLCAGTGSDSRPYKENGYDVRWITKKIDVRTYAPPENVYGIIANPPCTMFSLARTRAKTPSDFKQGMELVIACLKVIWECRYKNKLAFWVLENPMGYLRQFLGKPVLTYDPYEYARTRADGYTKRTDLWGYFNIPKKNKKSKLENWATPEEIKNLKINNKKLPSISDFTGGKQSERRAQCPRGFQLAFYEANK